MFFWFDFFVGIIIMSINNILPKIIIAVFSRNDQKILYFWLSRYVYIYI